MTNWKNPLPAPLALSIALAGSAAYGENNPTPAPDDASALTFKGLTLYGNVDLGVQYQTHGAPASDYIAYSTEPVIQKNGGPSVTALVSSPLSWSRIGLAGHEPLTEHVAAVLRLETYFNPTSGNLSDGLKSLTLNNGRSPASQNANLDSSVAGQLFGGAAFVGLSSPAYGTLTFGRHQTILADGIVKYDALEDGQDSAHAFSLLGGSRTAAGGGTTEDTRLDRSVKYTTQFEWLRVGALYQLGEASGPTGSAVQGELGVTLAGASVDTYYAKKYDAISATALTAVQVSGLAPEYSVSSSVQATVSDNTAYAFMALYDFQAIKVYAGYEHIRFANPENPLPVGSIGLGGYVLADVSNAAYTNDRVLEIFWGGVKWYLTPNLYLAMGGYGYRQNAYAIGANAGCASTLSSSCSGSESAGSLLGDYRINDHFDTYVGTLWTRVADGLASGYLNSSTLTTTAGVRIKF